MQEQMDNSPYSLGREDAWGDDLLPEVFLPIEQFSEIYTGGKTFLWGRRGSGKSAIARILERQPSWKYAEAVQGERQVYGAYMNAVRSLKVAQDKGVDVDIKEAVRRLWDWILPVKAMQTIVQKTQERSEPIDNEVREMHRYLSTLPGLHVNSRIGDLLSVTFQHARKLLLTGEMYEYLLNLTGSKEFFSALKALESKSKSNRVLIVLDTLESYKVFAPYMIEGFQGVVDAIVAFVNDPAMKNVTIKFFMPAEIFDMATIDLPGKTGGSSTAFMRWRVPDLISMVSKRFLNVLERTKQKHKLSDKLIHELSEAVELAYKKQDGRRLRDVFWYNTKFLPQEITNNMGRREDCFAYMYRHTFRRPRDLITGQMQRIVHLSVKARDFPYISEESVRQGLHDTSVLRQIVGDAVSPFEGNVPVQLLNLARSAFAKSQWIMTGRDLSRFAKALYNLYPRKFQDIDPEHVIHLLLRCGVIGRVVERRPPGNKREVYCKGMFEYMMRDVLTYSFELDYCFHPAFGDLLGLVPPKDHGAIYTYPEEDLWLEEKAEI
jgi:hypothetical protein